MIRVAAVGDVHLGEDIQGRHRQALRDVADRADVLLLAGDLTRHGTEAEGRLVASEYADLGLPVVAVLGNHDYHSDQQKRIRQHMEAAGICVLEGESMSIEARGTTVGIAGVKGFGLGFAGRCASDFGEPEMRDFARHGRECGARLLEALESLDTDVRIALTHYAPVDSTLIGEPREIWPFLGNFLLGEAIDQAGVSLAVHGHAHAGIERGLTEGGVRVRNVAQPVIRAAYGLYELASSDQSERITA